MLKLRGYYLYENEREDFYYFVTQTESWLGGLFIFFALLDFYPISDNIPFSSCGPIYFSTSVQRQAWSSYTNSHVNAVKLV